jgi:hypothetical protein
MTVDFYSFLQHPTKEKAAGPLFWRVLGQCVAIGNKGVIVVHGTVILVDDSAVFVAMMPGRPHTSSMDKFTPLLPLTMVV